MNSTPASSPTVTKPALAPKALRPVVVTGRRERSLHRCEFSPVRHSTHTTIATIGLLWVAAAAANARAATPDQPMLVERGRDLVEKSACAPTN